MLRWVLLCSLHEDTLGNISVIYAYPRGEERVRINEAFDRVIEALKADGFLHELAETEIPEETQYQARNYWTPELNSRQWALLNNKMDTEIMSESNFLDSATKWLYANEKGVEVFALYGIGDGTEPTVLYASGGATASKEYKRLTGYLGEHDGGTDNSRDTSNSWLKAISDAKREYHALYDAGGHRGKALGLDNILSKQLERIRNRNSEQSLRDSEGLTADGIDAEYFDSQAVSDDTQYQSRKKAVMSPARINEEIEDSGAGKRTDYAQKWITSINPTDFLNMTLGKTYQAREKFDTLPGDYGTTVNDYDFIEGGLKKSRRSPHLSIDVDTGKVVGHEGRHRMRALEKEGVNYAEIVVKFIDERGLLVAEKNGYGNPLSTIDSLTIYNQNGTGQSTVINNIIPLNNANRENVMASYGQRDSEDDTQYQARDIRDNITVDEDVTPEAVRATLQSIYDYPNQNLDFTFPIIKEAPFVYEYATKIPGSRSFVMYANKAAVAMLDRNDDDHALGVDGLMQVIDKLKDPDYIVYERNGRNKGHYIAIVTINDGDAVAAVDIGNYRNGQNATVNNENGYYDVLITAYNKLDKNAARKFATFDDYVLSLVDSNVNDIVYDKEKDEGAMQVALSERLSGRADLSSGERLSQNDTHVKRFLQNEIADGMAEIETFSDDDETQYLRRVTPQDTVEIDGKEVSALERLERDEKAGKVTRVYRAMQVRPIGADGNVISNATINGVVSYEPLMVKATYTTGKNKGQSFVANAELFSPMAGQDNTGNGKVWRSPIKLGEWEMSGGDIRKAFESGKLLVKTEKNKYAPANQFGSSIEELDTIERFRDNEDENASYGHTAFYFDLEKGNGSSAISARYNPLVHTSLSALNDQFSSAQKRPELVTVETIVPNFEIDTPFYMEGAKDKTGRMSWHTGPVSSRLAHAGNPRIVILSRFDKPIRVVPDSEVARSIKNNSIGNAKEIAIPATRVTPSLAKELKAIGVDVLEGEAWKKYVNSHPNEYFDSQAVSDDTQYQARKKLDDSADDVDNPRLQKAISMSKNGRLPSEIYNATGYITMANGNIADENNNVIWRNNDERRGVSSVSDVAFVQSSGRTERGIQKYDNEGIRGTGKENVQWGSFSDEERNRLISKTVDILRRESAKAPGRSAEFLDAFDDEEKLTRFLYEKYSISPIVLETYIPSFFNSASLISVFDEFSKTQY